MEDIKIGRYSNPDDLGYTGYIEPVDRSWVIFLDATGTPSVYWPERDEEGAVVGEPIPLYIF